MRLVLRIIGSLLIVAVGAGGWYVFGRPPAAETRATDEAAEAAGPLVAVVQAQEWGRPFNVTVNGEAVTPRILTIGAEIAGRVLHKPPGIQSGSFVHDGDVLFEIDPANYQLRVDELTAQHKQVEEEILALDVERQNVESLIRIATEDWQLQKKQLDREAGIFRKGAISEVAFEDAVRRELTARNALQTQQNQLSAAIQKKKTTQAALSLAAASLRRAQLDLQKCLIKSPINGRIIDDSVEKGDFVQAGAAVVHISETAQMEVKCNLQTEELAWIWLQRHIDNATDSVASDSSHADESSIAHTNSPADTNSITDTGSNPDKSASQDPLAIPQLPCEVVWEFDGVETVWDGTLSRLEGTGIDRQTRTFPCRILVPHPRKSRIEDSHGNAFAIPAPSLVSGMYVTIRIPVRSPQPLVQIPVESIRPGRHVWVLRDNVLHVREADVVRIEDSVALVRSQTSGIAAGDSVIVSPLASVVDGMSVHTDGIDPE